MSPVGISLLVAVISLVGVLAVGVLIPLYLVGRASRERRDDMAEAARQHREDRDAEWKRQDEIAARAAAATKAITDNQRMVADRADEAARKLLEAQNEETARVAQAHAETSDKLDDIHELVNSNMTSAMQAERDAVSRELAVMRELMELRRASGTEPSQGVTDAIAATEARVAELDRELAERRATQDRIDKRGGGEAQAD